jgi:uncharacterized membrane-anchored protein
MTVEQDPTQYPQISAPETPPKPKARIPIWRILVPLLGQILIITTIPAQKAMTLATGTTVFLQTAPVDPYDLLRGRYVTLDYEIANRALLEELPGGQAGILSSPEFYIHLEPSTDSTEANPTWRAVAISADYPRDLPSGQVAIRGQSQSWRIDVGLGQYFIPDQIGDALEADMNRHPADTRVEAKVDSQGNAALVRLWIQDRTY